ncbi:MAG: hypothetical protein A2381_08955 [Bdellovibrionales bacterium RIFOXYB1_FULL_37_110]|nr:MAG: hypothetical protein A2181_09150 [Bdellovibrionales bacterium RIFOXYA1_FULL_38_20]OFZ50356.1 MAG: hypothetical protein A2417_09055 [Bdellovibrionales bacterium RIFOXYC1_FULL_37_79]OFZ60965.1 MAG: hypothetical protein A2381_08955 [Bdellovibrionales bacterium RIFOXYB1_FULL_37_110]OFZ63709.1 MAG: hypothetical protein A2577_08075 [Bdellovibrionales bacterium RIFOXYD1_FULL_36_51]
MNFSIYFLASILVYLGLFTLIGLNHVLYVYLITYTVVILSLILLFYFGKIIFKSMSGDRPSKKEITIALFIIIIKNALVLITLYWGYKIIEKKIIYAVGLYLVQVIILFFSIRKNKNQ